MGKREHRLQSPEAFRRALRSKPVARSGPVALYQVGLSEPGQRLGFVLPKRLVRSAVHRNQIKRWCRIFFQQDVLGQDLEMNLGRSLGWVVRVTSTVDRRWSRTDLKAEIRQPLETLFATLKPVNEK
jgi:RNase P protein component